MDDDYMFNEKQSIRESARSLKKYGSTCNHVRNDEVLIRHEIEKTDTLQGIALKYGCTVSRSLRPVAGAPSHNRRSTFKQILIRQHSPILNVANQFSARPKANFRPL